MLYQLALLGSRLGRPVRHDSGATAVEYALLIMVIALVMVGGAIVLGVALRDFFDDAGVYVDSL